MKQGVLVLLGVFLAQASPLDSLRQDTLRYVLPPVPVEAARTAAGFVPLRVVSSQEFVRLLCWQGAEVLSGLPGIFVRDYGGMGGLKTVSVRGLAAAQTLLLWDGVRLNTALHGVYDLSLIPSSFVEEVEVVSAAASAVAGGYAGSGVLVFRTLPAVPESSLRFLLGGGSFGQRRLAAQGTLVATPFLARLGMEYVTARGDYPFVTNQFGQLRRERRQNGDYTAAAVLVRGEYRGEALRTGFQLLARRSWRGVPGPVVQGRIEFVRARLEEEEELVQVHGSVLTGLEAQATLRRMWLQYRDPDARAWGAGGAYDDATGWESTVRLGYRGAFGTWTASGWGELRYETVRGTLLRPQGRQAAARHGGAVGAAVQGQLAPLGELFAALRWETHRQYAPAWSPAVGLQREFDPFRLQLQWSANFRPPSFAELYYFNFGNAALRPERTTSWNFGLVYPIGSARWHLRLDVFWLRVRDQIVAVPRSPVFWSAANVGRVESRGVELSAAASFPWLRLEAQLSWQRVTDQTANPYTRGRQLPYVPLMLAAGRSTVVFSPLEATLQLSVVGDRWSQADNAPESRLPPAVLLDGFLEALLPVSVQSRMHFRLAVRNLLGTSFELLRSYPLPGRSLRAELALEWQPAQ